MRPIKFRAWDKDEKRMLYYDSLSSSHRTQDSNGEQSEIRSTMTWHGAVYLEGKYLGERLELMQFTGLTDRNGKEIWEGDVVKHDGHAETHRVVYERGGFCGACGLPNEQIEVLGNIWENPELLKPQP